MFSIDNTQSSFSNSSLEECIKKLKNSQTAHNYRMKIERDRKEHEHNMKLVNGITFEIVKVYKDKSVFGENNDYVEVSNYEHALEIFREYRMNGFNLKLHSLTLNVDGEKWHKVNFKY